jgi:hypothetical protein
MQLVNIFIHDVRLVLKRLLLIFILIIFPIFSNVFITVVVIVVLLLVFIFSVGLSLSFLRVELVEDVLDLLFELLVTVLH